MTRDINFKKTYIFKHLNKTKLLSNSDSRDITIEELEKNVITVNCGKIYGIFEFEKYIKKYIDNIE